MHWTLPLALLGVIAFCSFVGEGSASDWSAVYMTQELGTSQALGALAFAAFAVTMATTRFFADSLRDPVRERRTGAHRLARGGGRPRTRPADPRARRRDRRLRRSSAWASPRSSRSPSRRPARSDPRATGRLVGRVATVGYVGTVAGPIAIGWLAEATSLRTSLGLVVLLALLIASLSGPALERPQAV